MPASKFTTDNNSDLQAIRDRLIHYIYLIFTIVGLFAYIPSVYFAINEQLWLVTVVDTLVYGFLVFLFFRKTFSYLFRAYFFIVICYLIGLSLLLTVRGEYALIWFFSAPISAAILLGFRTSIYSLLVNTFILVTGAALINNGLVQWSYSLTTQDTLNGWLIISVNFLLLNTITTITVGSLLEYLSSSLSRAQNINRQLEEKSLSLENEIEEREKVQEENRCVNEKLSQAKRMEAIGLMAGGVAHDLNNTLSGVINYPELILQKLPDDSEIRRHITAIKKAGLRAADIVSDLLAVARGFASVLSPVDANDLVKDYIQSPEAHYLQKQFPHTSLEISLDTSSSLIINCSEYHIIKCINNLVSNAFEAIDDSGNVLISTSLSHIHNDVEIEEGEYVVLTVSDTGSGIAAEDLTHIFEPFYTRKVMGRSGTGLGLAVVWNTMQSHNGYVRVTSSNNGTSFIIYFPAVEYVTTEYVESEDLSQYTGNNETILVVDDNEEQRNIAFELLTGLNYQVVLKASGEAAVEFLKSNNVDLLILDMIMMPGINGLETYRRISAFQPDLPTLICSGYSDTEDVTYALELGATDFMAKPYTQEKIYASVHQILNKISNQ